MIKINRQNLTDSQEGPWLILDLLMMSLLLFNLAWIILDSLYATSLVRDNLHNLLPSFIHLYEPVHQNFALIDLAFIAIFLSEFMLRWLVAIRRKTYLRWYFFPFIHWYDLIGCLPLSSARIFRFLRLFSILYRLHKFQIINLRDTLVFRFLAFYYDVFVEELSDRIVVKVLSDAQKDISAGSPLLEDINQQVLATRKPILVQWAAAMLTHLGTAIEDKNSGEAIRQHVQHCVGKAVRDNRKVSTLALVPVLGGTIERTLEQAVTDIVTQSLINLLKEVNAEKINQFIDHGLGQFSPQEQKLDQEVLMVINECLELVKSHVSQQRWKAELQERDRQKAQQKVVATDTA